MTIKLAGVDIADVKVGGVQAQRVMVGTGTTAVEAWSASAYPVSGTWGPSALAPGGAQYGSHTMTESGTFTVTHTLTAAADGALALIDIGGVFTTSAGTTSQNRTVTATATVTLAPDDAVSFWAGGSGTGTGTWTVTKT